MVKLGRCKGREGLWLNYGEGWTGPYRDRVDYERRTAEAHKRLARAALVTLALLAALFIAVCFVGWASRF